MSENTVLFDPGYGKYLSSFIANINVTYSNMAKFKNINQRKFLFQKIYSQIVDIINQNSAFYLGCLLWATYVHSIKGAELSGNLCLGGEYDEDKELQELKFMIEFIKSFSRDTKYYLNKEYSFPEYKMDVLNIYIEFSKLNKGFVSSKSSDDIKLPTILKTPTKENIQKIYDVITKEVVTSGDFERLWTLKDLII